MNLPQIAQRTQILGSNTERTETTEVSLTTNRTNQTNVDKNHKNSLWWANPSGFDVVCLHSAYVSELTTHRTANQHQCRSGTLPTAGRKPKKPLRPHTSLGLLQLCIDVVREAVFMVYRPRVF